MTKRDFGDNYQTNIFCQFSINFIKAFDVCTHNAPVICKDVLPHPQERVGECWANVLCFPYSAGGNEGDLCYRVKMAVQHKHNRLGGGEGFTGPWFNWGLLAGICKTKSQSPSYSHQGYK